VLLLLVFIKFFIIEAQTDKNDGKFGLRINLQCFFLFL
jgi:hypothetical protein